MAGFIGMKYKDRTCIVCGVTFAAKWSRSRYCSVGCQLSSQLQKEGDCLVWTGHLNASGYGLVTIKGRCARVPRAVWEHAKGDIPTGLLIRHKCDNPRCANIEHLELGTQKENMADCISRQRLSRGSKRHNAKLTEADVTSIKRRLRNGEKCTVIASDYGVASQAISDIKHGRNWRHLQI
jgi:hypothetical protein